MANNELLEEVMQHIELNHDLWNQGDWYRVFVNGWDEEQIKALLLEDPDKPPCGSAGCFAGNACVLEDWVPVFRPPSVWADQEYWQADEVRPRGEDNGERRDISQLARELLGISEYTAERLFAAENDIFELRRLVDAIKEFGNLEAPDIDTCDCEYCRESDENEFEPFDEPF